MRRFKALLFAAGLAATPVGAAANPSPNPATVQPAAAKPRLGMHVMPLTPELRTHYGAAADRGVLVARVLPLSPAAIAGIQPGDVVTEVRGRAVAEATDVIAALADPSTDHTAVIKLVRAGKPLELTVKLASDPLGWLRPSWLEMLLRPITGVDHYASQT